MKPRTWITLSGALAVTPLLVGAASAGAASAGATQAAGCTSVPFAAGMDGYNSFRIPAIVRTQRGTLVAFAEGRVNSSADSGNIDIVARRSTDDGCTWGPLGVVADYGDNTIGNPSPVVDPRTGRIVLLATTNGGDVTEAEIDAGQVTAAQSRRVWVLSSGDDGQTWTSPREITASVKRSDWRWYATGPGHAVLITHGPHRGRLVVSADHTTAESPDATTSVTGVNDLYSDNGGLTWHLGFTADNPDTSADVHGNETTAAELPDGRLYFNSRNSSGPAGQKRADAYSDDGGLNLSRDLEVQPTISGPTVEGSVLQLTGGPLIYSGPANNNARASMTMRESADGGATWASAYEVSTELAGYSDVVQIPGRTVGLLYETGTTTYHDEIEFTQINGLY
jgi:sialidase-1